MQNWVLSDNFNSIKVRLKRHIRVGTDIQVEFQFHKGTIKTVIYRRTYQ